MGVLILNYHRISKNDEEFSKEELENLYTVSESNFLAQIKKIIELKIPIVPISTVSKNSRAKELCVAVSFDDGNLSDYEIAFPILKKLNVPATFFVLVNDKVNWSHLKEMSDSGFGIESHGIMHQNLTKLKTTALQEELLMSKIKLEKELNLSVESLSVPYGRYDRRILSACKKVGYKYLFSTRFGVNSSQKEIYKRWSIKSTTSLKEFEKTLSSHRKRSRLEKWSKFKYLISKMLGKNSTDSLNKIVQKKSRG